MGLCVVQEAAHGNVMEAAASVECGDGFLQLVVLLVVELLKLGSLPVAGHPIERNVWVGKAWEAAHPDSRFGWKSLALRVKEVL